MSLLEYLSSSDQLLGWQESRFARPYVSHGIHFPVLPNRAICLINNFQAYPATGTFESQGPCPSSHPVRMAQLMYEVIYETAPFNDPSLWPGDGSQPFVYSFGDKTGFGNHGDYVFGWKDDSLQKILDEECYVGCQSMRTQSIEQMNACSIESKVQEDVGDESCKLLLYSCVLPTATDT